MAKATAAKKQLASTKDYAKLEFGAALTGNKVDELERSVQLPCHGISRRVGLMILTKTKAQLVEPGDDKLLGGIFDALTDYTTHLKAQLEIMTAARVRTLSALATLHIQAQKKNARRSHNKAAE